MGIIALRPVDDDIHAYFAGADHVHVDPGIRQRPLDRLDGPLFPEIAEGLLKRGHSEEDVRKILGENHLRVLQEAIG